MSGVILQAGTLWWREIVRFVRQRSRVTGAFLQPLLFWAVLGAGMTASFRPSGMPAGTSYVEYFYPGVIMLVLLFTAIFGTVSTIEDRREGFLQGVLVAPVSRATVVMGQALGGTTLALIQGLVFLVLAPLAGIHMSVAAVLISGAMMAVIAFALTSIGLIIAWRMESTQGFHVIVNMILIPVWLLSGAFFPQSGVPGWLGWPMRVNPLTYGMSALRRALYLGEPNHFHPIVGFGWSIAISVVFAVVMFAIAARVARRSAPI